MEFKDFILSLYMKNNCCRPPFTPSSLFHPQHEMLPLEQKDLSKVCVQYAIRMMQISKS